MLRLLKRLSGVAEEERTPLLRQIAEHVASAREHFARADGEPDWNGRTYAYRQWIREVFDDAGIPRDEHPTLQSAIRYHLGSVLRERLDPQTLEDYGLIAHSPRERSAERRQGRSALLSALTSRDLAGGALMAITAAHTVLSKVQPKDLDEIDGSALAVADTALADLDRRVKALRRRIAARA